MSNDTIRSIVIFYSYEGDTRFIADIIAQTINAHIIELKPKKDMQSKGFMKYVWGGRKVLFRQKPELEPFNLNPEKFDLFFIGTPVWAYTYTPALRSFFSQVTLHHKKIAVFCCHEGGMRNTLDNMINELQGNTIIGKNDFLRPLYNNKDENERKASDWAKKIIKEI